MSPVSISSIFHDLTQRIATYKDGICLRISFIIWPLELFGDVSFVGNVFVLWQLRLCGLTRS